MYRRLKKFEAQVFECSKAKDECANGRCSGLFKHHQGTHPSPSPVYSGGRSRSESLRLARLTHDLDIVYSRKEGNLRRIVKALQNTSPYLRGAPPGLPFRLDLRTLKNGLNFTPTTDLGPLDLLGDIPGARSYEELLSDSFEISEQDLTFRSVKLERLIQLKNAAGQPKDLESLAELRAILEALEE